MISKAKSDFIRSLADPTGHIEPARVIAAARDPVSPIHNEFTWDVNEAAQQHWLDQARALIRFVRLEIEIERNTVIAPYYVVDPHREPRTRTYLALDVARREEETALKILNDECDRIAAAVRRAQQVAKVLNLADELEEILDGVAFLKTKAEKSAEERARAKASGKPGKRGRKVELPVTAGEA